MQPRKTMSATTSPMVTVLRPSVNASGQPSINCKDDGCVTRVAAAA